MMDFILEDYHRNTPDNELIDDLKSVAVKLKKSTVTMLEYNENGKFHSSTLQRRFGSWFRVLELAELQASRSKLNISENELFVNLEKVWTRLGRQPKYVEMKKNLSEYSVGTYEKKFGSWQRALKLFIEYINNDVSSENKSVTKNKLGQNNKNKNFQHKTKREISDRLRFRILMRDGFSCKKCGKSPSKEFGTELHVDHIIPWSKGGETIPENLETKCKQCNLGKGNAFNV